MEGKAKLRILLHKLPFLLIDFGPDICRRFIYNSPDRIDSVGVIGQNRLYLWNISQHIPENVNEGISFLGEALGLFHEFLIFI